MTASVFGARPRSAASAHAWLHLIVLIWGFTAILGKQLVLNATALVWYRQLITVAVVAAWALLRGISLRVPPRRALQLIGVGGLVAFHWVCFYACIKAAGVAVGVLCLASLVLFTALVEPLAYRRAVRPAEVVIGLLVVAGVWLLVRVGAEATVGAVLLGLGAALGSAVFGTLNGRLRPHLSPVVITIWELSAGAAWLSLYLALVSPSSFVAPADVVPMDWLWLAVLSVVCTALPWIWSLEVLAVLTPYTVALATTLEPVYSIVIAYFWFPESERLTPAFYGGAALLIALILLNARIRRAVA